MTRRTGTSPVRVTFAVALATLLACSGDKDEPTPLTETPATEQEPAPESKSEEKAPNDPEPPKEPEWVWTPPTNIPTSSPACGSNPPGMWGETFTTPSGRTYHVWGPWNYDPNKTYPVVLTYHGWQSNGRDFQSWFHMDDYVDGEAFVVYPDGIGGYWDLAGDKDLVFFDEMVKKLGETYCIDPSHVFAFGFSFGGFFADYLGCKRAGYVKAVSMGASGRGGPGTKCGRLPVLVTSRTHDHDETVSKGKNLTAHWAKLNECGEAQTSNEGLNCVTHAGCNNPGTVTFCEDTWFDPGWKREWNHTVREEYRAHTWKWFKALP